MTNAYQVINRSPFLPFWTLALPQTVTLLQTLPERRPQGRLVLHGTRKVSNWSSSRSYAREGPSVNTREYTYQPDHADVLVTSVFTHVFTRLILIFIRWGPPSTRPGYKEETGAGPG